MLVETGRTLIARNRCHAAQLLSEDDDAEEWIRWYEARARRGFFDKAVRMRNETCATCYREALRRVLLSCVAGIFTCKRGQRVIRSLSMARSETFLSGSDVLTRFLLLKMATRNLTSVQLVEQPEGDRWDANHEILVRVLLRSARMRDERLWRRVLGVCVWCVCLVCAWCALSVRLVCALCGFVGGGRVTMWIGIPCTRETPVF